jgi:hypothetical protein
VTTFEIRFLSAPETPAPSGSAYGEIRIGSFRERFESDLSFWSTSDYERQWRTGASRILQTDRAALITSMGDPSSANFIRWWPMYRQGEMVIFHEHLLFLEELTTPFDPEMTEKFVRDRETLTEDGQPISEWTTSLDTIRAFLTAAQRQLPVGPSGSS